MVKILFHTTQIDVRGTCNALYYYAHYNEKILNNESYILTRINNPKTDTIAFVKFNNRFKIHFYNEHNKQEIQDIIDRNGYDILYDIKYGKNDGFLFKNIKNVVHYVFDATEPHGDVFAGVSETLANKFGKSLYVPHMIGLEPSKTGDNLRTSLKIPKKEKENIEIQKLKVEREQLEQENKIKTMEKNNLELKNKNLDLEKEKKKLEESIKKEKENENQNVGGDTNKFMEGVKNVYNGFVGIFG